MKRVLFIIGILVLLQANGFGRHRQFCQVRFEQGGSWSPQYKAKVVFMSGTELNAYAHTNKFDQWETYALIKLASSKSIIVHITTFTGCGEEVDEGCIVNTMETIEGVDGHGNRWEIRTQL